jgi:PPK2 family polyphosphate:nucleotide phosphotransferase
VTGVQPGGRRLWDDGRTSALTVWPRASSRRASRLPTYPVAPVMNTLVGRMAPSPSRAVYQEILPAPMESHPRMPSATELIIEPGRKVRLAEWDPDDTGSVKEPAAIRETDQLVQRIAELQAALTAESKQALLIVLQAMDTGGKDPTIREVMWATNPAHCNVKNFKAPSTEEKRHDYLWRFHPWVPGMGEIGIFNRSYYEEVLGAKVNNGLSGEELQRRYRQMNDFELYLTEQNIRFLKFFFHISNEEQRRRLQARIDDPKKQWELSESDFTERKKWDHYMEAFEGMLSHCSTPHAPWRLVPANRDWYRNLIVARTVVEALEEMDPQYPEPSVDMSKLSLD